MTKASSALAELAHQVALEWSVEEECEFWFQIPTEDVRRHHAHDNDSCSGKVKRWPMRMECKKYHTVGSAADRPRLECWEVSCLGWIACEEMAVLCKELEQAGIRYLMGDSALQLGRHWARVWKRGTPLPTADYNDDPKCALFQAAAKWAEATCAG